MLLILVGETKTLFDLVGRVHELRGGWNFNEIAFMKSVHWNGWELQQVSYLPHISTLLFRRPRKSLVIRPPVGISKILFPDRFEHFLQLARAGFPGKSFQEIRVCCGPDHSITLSID